MILEKRLQEKFLAKKKDSIGMWILFAFVSTKQIKIQYYEIASD